MEPFEKILEFRRRTTIIDPTLAWINLIVGLILGFGFRLTYSSANPFLRVFGWHLFYILAIFLIFEALIGGLWSAFQCFKFAHEKYAIDKVYGITSYIASFVIAGGIGLLILMLCNLLLLLKGSKII